MPKRKVHKGFYEKPKFASYDVIKSIADNHAYTEIVWPDEGEFVPDGFVFNGDHAGFEPLGIDATTARMLVVVHDALNEKNAAKFREWLEKGRGHFGAMVEFGWKHTSFGPSVETASALAKS